MIEDSPSEAEQASPRSRSPRRSLSLPSPSDSERETIRPDTARPEDTRPSNETHTHTADLPDKQHGTVMSTQPPQPAPPTAQAQPPLIVTPSDNGYTGLEGYASFAAADTPNDSEAEVKPGPGPPSAHDTIVSQFVRPAAERSQSSPAMGAPAPLVPPLPSLSPQTEHPEDSRPVSSMLDGALEPSGTRVTRALGSQIEAVLAAQEEIGKRHLALEGWKSDDLARMARADFSNKEPRADDIRFKAARDAKAAELKASKDKDSGKEKAKKEGERKEATEVTVHELEKRAQGVEDIMARVSMTLALARLAMAEQALNQLGRVRT